MFKFFKKKMMFGYNHKLDDLQKQWSKEVEELNANTIARLNTRLEEELEEYNSGECIDVKVESGIDDRYLTVGTIRGIPCKKIAKVSIKKEGGIPYINVYYRSWNMYRHAFFKGMDDNDIPPSYDNRELPELREGHVYTQNAQIVIHMDNGVTENIVCKHREVHDLFDRIMSAWIGGEATVLEKSDI